MTNRRTYPLTEFSDRIRNMPRGRNEVRVPASWFSTVLRATFGPRLPDAKTPEESTWEGEGGALAVRCEGYEHTFEVVQP